MLFRLDTLHSTIVTPSITDLLVVGVVERSDVHSLENPLGHALQFDTIFDESKLPIATLPVVVGYWVVEANDEERSVIFKHFLPVVVIPFD